MYLRFALFIAVSFLLNACSDGGALNRGYVITKTHVDPEVEENIME